MKNNLKQSIIFITLVFISMNAMAQWGKKNIKGNGIVTTKTISTSDYDEIAVTGSLDVHLQKGDEGSIAVTTDENLQEYIEVTVKGNKLSLRVKKDYSVSTKKGIHITVPFETLENISLTGSGDIDTKDVIEATTMKVSLTGSGDIVLALNAFNVDSSVTGSGDVTLSGNTNTLNVSVTGSGDFKGYDLKANNTDVTVSGSGDARVFAGKSIKARVNGSGDIVYKGNPEQKDTKVAGSGNIDAN